jgi:hypothetical protein
MANRLKCEFINPEVVEGPLFRSFSLIEPISKFRDVYPESSPPHKPVTGPFRYQFNSCPHVSFPLDFSQCYPITQDYFSQSILPLRFPASISYVYLQSLNRATCPSNIPLNLWREETSRLAQAVTLLTCIREVLRPNLVRDTNYSD